MDLTISSRPGEADDRRFDHGTFPYAGKFGRRATGTAIGLVADAPVAAIAFSPDRTDASRCRIRYLAVRRDRQGAGHGRTLARRFTDWAHDAGYDAVAITVVNPYGVTSLYRAGYRFAGETGPAGGVVLGHPPPSDAELATTLAALETDGLSEDQRRYVHRYVADDDAAADVES